MPTVTFTQQELDSWKRKAVNCEDYIECHNFIVRHIRNTKVGFWGRRKLRHTLKHLFDYLWNNGENK